jgi:hypothetical protein
MRHMHVLRAYALLRRFNAPKRGVAKTQFHQHLAKEKEPRTRHLVNNLVNKMVDKSDSVIPSMLPFLPIPDCAKPVFKSPGRFQHFPYENLPFKSLSSAAFRHTF